MNELITNIAEEHGLEVTVEEHSQMFGSRLYQVRTTGTDGKRHSFDYVPNPQHPLSIRKQKVDQMMLSLREMTT